MIADSRGPTDNGIPWLDASGPESMQVISTRVRLARNLAHIPFWGRNSPAQREGIVELVAEASRTMPAFADATLHRLDSVSAATRQWLNERQLASRDLAGLTGDGKVRSGAAVLVGPSASAMINEEDHLRLQGFRSGFAVHDAFDITKGADRELGVRVSFAFHPEFGYLTACPTNVGTGLRASVLIHLPALVMTGEISKVLQGLGQVGLTYRGLFGEGSEALGHLFQLSNQTTLGKSEAMLLDHLTQMVRQVIDYEDRARDVLRGKALAVVEDNVWRAWGILHHARALTFDEVVHLLGSVRLGIALQILPSRPLGMLNRLLVQGQAAHVSYGAGVPLDAETIPQHRATLVRRMFEEVERR